MEPKNSASLRFKVNSVEKKQLQPAKGARDLNPKQVEINHLIASKLSNVFKLWGYEEVSPPNIERQPTKKRSDQKVRFLLRHCGDTNTVFRQCRDEARVVRRISCEAGPITQRALNIAALDGDVDDLIGFHLPNEI